MQNPDERITQALEQTRVVRPPKQHLATFGVTNLRYHLVTEPSYSEFERHEAEAVVRQGKVIAERPAVVTPAYMLRLEGFGAEGRRAVELLGQRHGPNRPGLLYTYRNEAGGLNIVGGTPEAVAQRITDEVDRAGDHLAAVIIGLDDLWDVSLLKFIYEFTAASVLGNMEEIRGRGLFDPEPGLGIPRAAVHRAEELFREVERGNADPVLLKAELDRWGLFQRYEDRFLDLFRRNRI